MFVYLITYRLNGEHNDGWIYFKIFFVKTESVENGIICLVLSTPSISWWKVSTDYGVFVLSKYTVEYR